MFVFRTFSALFKLFLCYQGRRVPLRFTLAPGYYISHLRRWAFARGYYISRLRRWAFALAVNFAPSALSSDFWCKALLICKSKRSRFAGGGEGADVGTVADEVFVVRGVGDEDGATLEGGFGNVFALQKQRAHFATTRAER